MNVSKDPHTSNASGSNRLLLFFLSTFVAAVVIAVSAMIMASGIVLPSTPEITVSRTSQILWGIAGLSFIPCTILLVALIGTHKRVIGIVLGWIVIVAGTLTAFGWFIDIEGGRPNTTQESVLVALVVVIPLLAGLLMLRQSASLKS